MIPGDSKWYARAAVADIITSKLEDLKLEFPKIAKDESEKFGEYIAELEKD